MHFYIIRLCHFFNVDAYAHAKMGFDLIALLLETFVLT